MLFREDTNIQRRGELGRSEWAKRTVRGHYKFRNSFIEHLEWRKWQPTPVSLPGKAPWTEEPGRTTVDGVTKSRTWLSKFTFIFKILEAEVQKLEIVLILENWLGTTTFWEDLPLNFLLTLGKLFNFYASHFLCCWKGPPSCNKCTLH